jgi:hypothetical protein
MNHEPCLKSGYLITFNSFVYHQALSEEEQARQMAVLQMREGMKGPEE